MASDETYRITIAAELDDRTEAAIRRVRSRVSAWEREEDRRRTRTLRREREAQRHHTHQARQQAVLHRATQMREREALRSQGQRIRVQREDVRLQRDRQQVRQAEHRTERERVNTQRAQLSLQRQQEQVEHRRQQRSLRARVAGGLRAIGGGLLRLPGRALGAAGNLMGNIFGLPGVVAGAATGAAAYGGIFRPLELVSELQQATVSMTRFLGSGQAAADMLEHIRRVALEQPLFGVAQLREVATGLLAFKFAAPDVKNMLPILADVASGLPFGAEAADRIARTFGQILSKGRVQGEELLQLQELGINAIDYLAAGWGIARESVLDYVQKGAVPARRAIRHILEGMQRDFGGLGKEQAKTLGGISAQLRETFDQRILLSWGQGLAREIQPRLERLVAWLETPEGGQRLQQFTDTLLALGGDLAGGVMGSAETFISDLYQRAQSHGGGMEGTMAAVGEIVGGFIGGLWERVTGWLGDRWGELVTRVDTFKTESLKRLGELKDTGLSELTRMVNWITGEFTNRIEQAIRELNPFHDLFGGPGGGGAVMDAALQAQLAPLRRLGPPGNAVADWIEGQFNTRRPAQPTGAGPITTSKYNAAVTPAAEQAIAKGMGLLNRQDWIGLCERFVEELFATRGQYSTAAAAGNALIDATVGGLGAAPRGSLVYFANYQDTGGAGHVGLSLGGGEFLSSTSRGVEVVGPGSADYQYWSKFYRGYGLAEFGSAAGETAPLEYQRYVAQANAPTTVNVGDINIDGAQSPEATAAAVRDTLLGLAIDLQDASNNRPLAR